MTRQSVLVALAALLTGGAAVACSDDSDNDGGTGDTADVGGTGDGTDTGAGSGDGGESSNTDGGETPAPGFGTADDLAAAESLWDAIQERASWGSFPGKEGFQEGASPHGAFVRFFINDAYAADMDAAADGSIIVKENFMEDNEESLAAITVMQKIAGYEPDAGDWFWVKFNADGTVAANPAGVSLAGRIGLGGDAGCIPCHTGAGGDDYVFMN